MEKDILYIREFLARLEGKIEGFTKIYMPRNEVGLIQESIRRDTQRVNKRINDHEDHTKESLDSLSTRVRKVENQVDAITKSISNYAKILGVIFSVVQPIIVALLISYFT